MLKLIGAILIVAATTWGGFEFAKRYSDRPKQIRQLRFALQSLEAEIMYGQTPLARAAEQIASQVGPPVNRLFEQFAEKLKLGTFSARHAWNESLEGVWKKTVLKKGEYEALRHFGETLGQHDVTSQQKYIKLALGHLESEEKEAEIAQAKNEKMVRSLGFLSGLLLILLLM
ncbi:stage III sporulation protein SpoIIIAB [Bacillus pumilus]|uniref:stage III sporulation protein SpoIIIAB n=1 Tax=Bacillus pumilus TaxID=1408 RepID=UPI002282455D|nr:stage III sporulation protein SpoIIIAB [Bacillus pumilus]MCY7572491.1 stage III sporulation protein SpoAB [Bacillus pumilus]MEC3761558.1 stage III sporulation protein SpoIIIAB [Bacillus pumilus]